MPDEFRSMALTIFGEGVERIIASSPSLRLLPPQQRPEDASDDEELAQPTIFPFVIRHRGRVLSLDDCRKIYRALAGMPEVAIPRVRGPIRRSRRGLPDRPARRAGSRRAGYAAALRICAGARLVTEAWSSDADIAQRNLQREIANVGAIIAKIEWLLTHMDGLDLAEVSHGA